MTRVLDALGSAVCEHGFEDRFAITAQVLEELEAALADGSYLGAFQRYRNIDVLLLDEFACEPFDPCTTQHIFRLVSVRLGFPPTLFAANLASRSGTTAPPPKPRASPPSIG